MEAVRMSDKLTRRQMTAAASVALSPLVQNSILSRALAQDIPQVSVVAGVDRSVVQGGKTYLRGWAGYGNPPRPGVPRRNEEPAPPPAPEGPVSSAVWTKESGPGEVKFADPKSLVTTASFSNRGVYILKLTADNGHGKVSSTLNVSVDAPPPARQLDAVYT